MLIRNLALVGFVALFSLSIAPMTGCKGGDRDDDIESADDSDDERDQDDDDDDYQPQHAGGDSPAYAQAPAGEPVYADPNEPQVMFDGNGGVAEVPPGAGGPSPYVDPNQNPQGGYAQPQDGGYVQQGPPPGYQQGQVYAAPPPIVVYQRQPTVIVKRSRPNAVVVYQRPPPVRIEKRPVRPQGNYFWIEGHWGAGAKGFTWVSGRWERERSGNKYVTGTWKSRKGGEWEYEPGYWKKR